MITAIYLLHNRLEFVQESLPAFLKACESDLVKNVMIYDDMSTDGASEYVVGHLPLHPKFNYTRQYIRSSWKQINATIPMAQKYLFKVDNDIVIPEGYLENLYQVMEANKMMGFLGYRTGLEMSVGDAAYETARNIGGVGLFRTEELRKMGGVREPAIEAEKRFFGFTDLQVRSSLKKAWVKGGMVKDLSMVHKDLQAGYIEEGITRKIVV